MLVIANEGAGSTERDAVDAAVAVFGDAHGAELVYTRDRAHLDEVLAGRHGRDVVVVGGDGSLHAVVAALHSRGDLDTCRLGLVPLGTGNDLARGLGLPLEPEDAAGVVLSGQPRRLDLLVDNAGGVVINAAHVGVGARAARAAAAWKSRLGRFAYPAGAFTAGLRSKGWRLDVDVDGEIIADWSGTVLMVALANGPSIAAGMAELRPGAMPDDGLVDVIVSHSVGPLARIGYAVDLGRGTHVGRSDITATRGRRVVVTGEPFLVDADGEVSGPFTYRAWTVMASAWELIVPPTTPASSTRQGATEAEGS